MRARRVVAGVAVGILAGCSTGGAETEPTISTSNTSTTADSLCSSFSEDVGPYQTIAVTPSAERTQQMTYIIQNTIGDVLVAQTLQPPGKVVDFNIPAKDSTVLSTRGTSTASFAEPTARVMITVHEQPNSSLPITVDFSTCDVASI